MKKRYRTIIIGALILLIIGFLVWYFQAILSYLLISAVFALIIRPLRNSLARIRIRKHHLPAWIIAILCLLCLYSVIVALFFVFVPLIADQAYAFSQIEPQKLIKSLEEPVKYLEDLMVKYQISDNPEIMAQSFFHQKITTFLNITNLGNIFNYFVSLTGDAFIAFFSITFITFFFTKDSTLPKRIILTITPNKHMEKMETVLKKLDYLLTRYFTGLIFQISGITLLSFLGLSLIGVKNALLIGFFAGVINIVPYLGPLMGALFGLLVASANNLSLEFTTQLLPLYFKIIGVFVVVQITDNLLFQPMIYGSSVKAHPLEIFIVILLAARIGGIPGMIIAIPAYTAIRVMAKEFLIQFKIVEQLTREI